MTCWAQASIVAHTIPQHTIGHPPRVYPVIAQLTGWCAVTVAAAAWVGRSRYADLGGAAAAPVGFAFIAPAWYAPLTARYLIQPPARPHEVTIAWYATAGAASVLAGVAVTDRWHRYSLRLRRLPAPGPASVTTNERISRRGRGHRRGRRLWSDHGLHADGGTRNRHPARRQRE